MEDANNLMYLAYERVLKFRKLENYISNMKKCDTWSKVRKSNLKKDRKELMTYEDILGMLLLWIIGLGSSLLVLMIEVSLQLCHKILTVILMSH